MNLRDYWHVIALQMPAFRYGRENIWQKSEGQVEGKKKITQQVKATFLSHICHGLLGWFHPPSQIRQPNIRLEEWQQQQQLWRNRKKGTRNCLRVSANAGQNGCKCECE